MNPQQLANDVADRLTRAAAAAKAGRADEAQGLLAPISPWGLPDEVLQGIGYAHYLSSNASAAVRFLQSVHKPDALTKLALSAALTAAGNKTLAAIAQHEALQADAPAALGVQTAEDLLADDEHDLANYKLPQGAWRGWGEANYALRRGDFDAARADYEAKCKQMPAFAVGADMMRTRSGTVRRWNGEDCKKLVLICPDGYGDLFLFGRYLDQMRLCADELVLLAQKPTVALVKHSAPWLDVRPFNDAESALRGADAYGYSWLLPTINGMGYGAAQWLQAPGKVDLGEGFHVGVVWSGSGVNRYDSLRSIPVGEFAPLFDLPGITWHSLTVGPRASEECPANVVDHSAELRAGGFAQTARLIAGLDLVVAIDSSVANLCGALGAPVWALAEADPDFRWGDAQLHGEGTPWFSSARVFRQAKGEGWGPVVAKMAEALKLQSQIGDIAGEWDESKVERKIARTAEATSATRPAATGA